MDKNKHKNKDIIKSVKNNIKIISKIKNVKDEYKEKVTKFLEIPMELTNKATKISVIDNKIMYLEGKNKIEDYYENYIKLKSENKVIQIDGKNLVITGMGNNDLVIEGKILSITYGGD